MSESAHLIHEFLKYMQQVTSKALPLDDLPGAVSAYDQNSSDSLYHIFGETRDDKTCMSPVVFDTKNVDITNPKTSLRPSLGL